MESMGIDPRTPSRYNNGFKIVLNQSEMNAFARLRWLRKIRNEETFSRILEKYYRSIEMKKVPVWK